MAARLHRHVELAPSSAAPGAARSMLREALEEAGLGELTDVALLLATELCTNAVQYAGTGIEVALNAECDGVTVSVADRGSTPLELSGAAAALEEPRWGGHGLRVVSALAAEWGTRHDSEGRHVVWFSLTTGGEIDSSAGSAPESASESATESLTSRTVVSRSPLVNGVESESAQRQRQAAEWPSPNICRWLLYMPASVTARLDLSALVTELLRRLCEVLDADDAQVVVDYGDGGGEQVLARHGGGRPPPGPASIEIPLTLGNPLRGWLRVRPRAALGSAEPLRTIRTEVHEELTDLSAQRIALAIESDWLRGADRRRRSWTTYLAETSELLAQSLDVGFSAALVPQIVVPRLGQWCAVHLFDERGRLASASWSHVDETALSALRAWLDGERGLATGALRPRLDEAVHSGRLVSFLAPVEAIAVPLIARGKILGTLTVGRPESRAHSAEDVALVSDVARRASLAIANAQLNAAHVTVSQAFQRALLPRALPESEQVEFAAAYLPASAGTDVGGDFYDVLALPGQRWLVAVGDVCGKGASAAARTGRVRDVLRVLVRDGYPLERAVRLLNDALDDTVTEPQFCTLAGAVVSGGHEPARRNGGLRLELVLAGHDQPILIRADGSVRFLGDYGTALGVLDEMKLRTTCHTLERGDTLVIYTDGVTERRRGGEQFGRDRLAEASARLAGAPAASVASALRVAARDFSPDPPKDDIALLVVKAR